MNNYVHVYCDSYTPTQNLWANIFEEWPNGNKDVNPDDMLRLYEIISGLTEQEYDIVKMRCGLGCKPMGYREIGKFFGVTPARISVISKRAFEKLRSVAYSEEIRLLYSTRGELIKQNLDQMERIRVLEKSLIQASSTLGQLIASPDTLENKADLVIHYPLTKKMIKVEDLGFSTKVSNSFKRHKIKTLEDIVLFGSKGVDRMRGIGRKYKAEIEDKLKEYGLSLYDQK